MSIDFASSLAGWQTASVDGTFEEAMEALESIVALLDTGELTLDQSIESFETGARLSARCQRLLEQAELRVELVQRQFDVDTPAEPPF
ncbi:MAG: exodeoxyribonuclease VII small subunit [Thermomicrobiales bacterium]|nr:exodeoxyribonuclease VII small subunit [Thermomicrobiales bacterium]MCO5221646.1 exodeoxyribonuclease VII small subunit [Thermomicrobiales bacterium]